MRLAVLLSLVFGLAASAAALAPGAGAAPLTGFCPFPITIDQTRGAQGDMGHFPTSGPYTDGFFTGPVFVKITNASNPNKSIELNISGPGFNLVDGTFVLSGVSLLLLRANATGDVAGPGMFITHGRIRLTFVVDHVNTQVVGGTVSGNLCPLIA